MCKRNKILTRVHIFISGEVQGVFFKVEKADVVWENYSGELDKFEVR